MESLLDMHQEVIDSTEDYSNALPDWSASSLKKMFECVPHELLTESELKNKKFPCNANIAEALRLKIRENKEKVVGLLKAGERFKEIAIVLNEKPSDSFNQALKREVPEADAIRRQIREDQTEKVKELVKKGNFNLVDECKKLKISPTTFNKLSKG